MMMKTLALFFSLIPFVHAEILNPPAMTDLFKASEQVYADVKGPSFSSEVCFDYLSTLEKNIDAIDVKSLNKADLLKNGQQIVNNAWEIRKALHARMPEFDKKCVIQLQVSFRQFRFIEEYILELLTQVEHLTPEEIDFAEAPVPVLDRTPGFYVLLENGQQPQEFMAGDLLVTRGVSFLSGMIARLGERGTQFSHTVFVHKDETSSKVRTIESYVGSGVQFFEMDFALRNENVRVLWLRAKDTQLAKKASLMMGNFVQERNNQYDPIKYDYRLDFTDHETMSCAEVSQVAFGMASEGAVSLPFYPNQVGGVSSLTDRLFVDEGPTYEPGDMEIDPRFELVAEFRDLRLTRDSRQKDAVMTSMFQWMREKDYVLKDNFKSKMAGGFVYSVRKTFLWPLVKKILKLQDFSAEIPRNMLRTVSLINELGEAFQNELRQRDLAFEKKYGVPMGYMDMYQAMEEIRVEDLELYQTNRKRSKFHKIFRAQ